jgi:hypothetical protein
MNIANRVFCVIGAVAAIAPVQGAPIQELISAADIVAVGSVQSRIESADNVSFDIEVQRTIKGEPQPHLRVSHQWSRKGIILGSDVSVVDQQLQGIWFLRRTGKPEWEVIPARGVDGLIFNLFLPALAAPSSAHYNATAVSPADKVIFEVASALQAQNTQPEILINAAQNWNSTRVSQILNDYLQSSNPSFRAVGLSGLLMRNAPGAVEILERTWPSIIAPKYPLEQPQG